MAAPGFRFVGARKKETARAHNVSLDLPNDTGVAGDMRRTYHRERRQGHRSHSQMQQLG